jgi:SAM-dependent methyltransferase
VSEQKWATQARPPRPDLAAGTKAHYESAEYYDRAYKQLEDDLFFYVQAAEELDGPVLELGCGTGRITLALARAGLSVTGVDLNPDMLAGAQAKLASASPKVRRRVELRQGDMRSLRLDRRFKLVISPFNAMQHLYTRQDFEGCCATVHHHLMPRAGRFVFDVLLPDVMALNRNPARRYKLGSVYHPRGDKTYLYRESFDYDPLTQVQFIVMHFDDPDDVSGSFDTPLAHRQFFPLELEALVHYNGFEVLERYGDFDKHSINEESESQIYLCRPAKSR